MNECLAMITGAAIAYGVCEAVRRFCASERAAITPTDEQRLREVQAEIAELKHKLEQLERSR